MAGLSPQPLSASALLTDKLGRDSINIDEVRISLVVAIIKVLEAYIQLYSSTAAFAEGFEPCLTIIEDMKSVENWNEDVKVCCVFDCIVKAVLVSNF
jgi:hypothetical protein